MTKRIQHQIETGGDYVESCTDNEPLLLDYLPNDGIEHITCRSRHDVQALVLRSRLWGLRFKAWDLWSGSYVLRFNF